MIDNRHPREGSTAGGVGPTIGLLRGDLLREAQHWLSVWERHRDPVARVRLLTVLSVLKGSSVLRCSR